jgi:hypothetical protein
VPRVPILEIERRIRAFQRDAQGAAGLDDVEQVGRASRRRHGQDQRRGGH